MSVKDENDRQGDGGDRELKVTDRRMFTPDGRLREEYRDLEEEGAAPEAVGRREPEGSAGEAARPAPGTPASPGDQSVVPPAGDGSASAGAGEPSGADPGAGAAAGGARVEIPSSGPEAERPGFLDLVAVLAEPVSIYLGDAELPDGRTAENLEAARLYIDLLDVLREKTRSNLTAQESRLLDDLLYRLRMRHVQKRG